MSRLDWQLAASHTSIDESGTDYLYWVDMSRPRKTECGQQRSLVSSHYIAGNCAGRLLTDQGAKPFVPFWCVLFEPRFATPAIAPVSQSSLDIPNCLLDC